MRIAGFLEPRHLAGLDSHDREVLARGLLRAAEFWRADGLAALADALEADARLADPRLTH